MNHIPFCHECGTQNNIWSETRLYHKSCACEITETSETIDAIPLELYVKLGQGHAYSLIEYCHDCENIVRAKEQMRNG